MRRSKRLINLIPYAFELNYNLILGRVSRRVVAAHPRLDLRLLIYVQVLPDTFRQSLSCALEVAILVPEGVTGVELDLSPFAAAV